MKALLCVAVLALVASTIAYPHQAAINNLHNLDNNVRKLLQMLVTNIQEELVSAEKQEQEEEEVFTLPPTLPPTDKLPEASDDTINEMLQLLDVMKAQNLEAEEKANAEKAMAEKAVAEKAVAEKAVAEKAVAEKAVAESEEVEYESFDSNNDQLSETVKNIDVMDLLRVLQRQAEEKAMAQRWGRK